MKVMITGANGFIGQELIKKLLNCYSFELKLIVRNKCINFNNLKVEYFQIDDIASQHDWSTILAGCDIIIHTAARVHILKEQSTDPLSEFRRINVDATVNLAKQAAVNGVKRFIFLSTVGVYGAETTNEPINEHTCYNPKTPYAISKLEAENQLFQISQSTQMEMVIIRPPLVIAENAPGNFEKLLHLASKRIFLPLGSIKNRRSFISQTNLIDFICCCIEHPMAKNQAFVIADTEDISTPEIFKYVREGMEIAPMIIPFPTRIIKWICKIFGKEAAFNQLSCSLQINCSKAQKLLNWQPKSSIAINLRQVGANYKKLIK